jgi:tRNA(Ile2) C34 agmatinyltransferase TiaS
MGRGHNCDNCDCHLESSDYDAYGEWSYTCPECGFRYRHFAQETAQEQVEEFNKK